MDGLTETESCSPKDDSAVLEVPGTCVHTSGSSRLSLSAGVYALVFFAAPAPSSSANLLDALRLQTGSSSEGDNTDSDTISDDDDSLDGGVGSGTDADKTPAAAPSDDVLDATAASFPARRRRSSLTRRHMQFQRQTSGNIPTVSDTAAPGPVVAMQPDTAPEEDEERTISSATSQDTALQALRKSMER